MPIDDFPQRIARLRKKRRLTIKQVADHIQVPVTTYRDWEYGRAKWNKTYLKLAELFDVSVFELLGGKNPEFSELKKEAELLEKQFHLFKLRVESLF